MTTLIIIGSKEHEAAAIEVLCRMHWKDLTCSTHKPGLFSRSAPSGAPASQYQYAVVDLPGLGMANYTADNEKRIFADLGGRATIMVIPSHGGGWEAANPPSGQRIIWLKKPLKSLALREAIQQLTQSDNPEGKAAGVGAQANNQHLASSSPSASGAHHSKSIQLLLGTFPTLRSDKATILIQKLATTRGPVNVPVGSATWVVDYSAGWLATNLRQSSTLLHILRQHIATENIDLGNWSITETKAFVNQLEARLSDVRKPLASFLWDFVACMTRDLNLDTKENLYIKLHYLPNFTVIEQADPIDLRLAAICTKSPQSLRTLCAFFPGQSTRVFRFVALCILSGIGTLSTAVTHTAADPNRTANAAMTTERRSFLRKLLDKLS